MKIVVLDGYTENPGDLRWDGLGALGELTVYDRTRARSSNASAARRWSIPTRRPSPGG